MCQGARGTVLRGSMCGQYASCLPKVWGGGGGRASTNAGVALVVAACFGHQKSGGKSATPCSRSTAVAYVMLLLCDTVKRVIEK